jgi:diaminopimelate epimerase
MSMIHFAKFQVLENDFLIVQQPGAGFRWTPRRVAAFCHRRLGIGADGLIVLGQPRRDGVRFRLFNADGSGAEWSGNGVRCAAAFLAGAKRHSVVRLLTAAGAIDLHVSASGLGQFVASFERPMPMVGPIATRGRRLSPCGAIGPVAVDAGNPHWIFVVPHFNFPWADVGRQAQTFNPRAHGVNVEFVRVLNRRRVEMRIFERGVGPTPSSGSGALAAVAACADRSLIDLNVRVLSPGGVQVAEINGDLNTIRLTAVTYYVFSGIWMAV